MRRWVHRVHRRGPCAKQDHSGMLSTSSRDLQATPMGACRLARCWTPRRGSSRSRWDGCRAFPRWEEQLGHLPRNRLIHTQLVNHREHASRRGPSWRAARQWQRPRPPTPTRPPTSAPSGRLRLPPPNVRPYATPIPVGSGFGRRFCSTARVLPQAPGARPSHRLPPTARVRSGEGRRVAAGCNHGAP